MDLLTQLQKLAILILITLVVLVPVKTVFAEENSNIKQSDTPYVFEKIEKVKLTKKEIIIYSVAFISEKFKSAKTVIQLKDQELGKIIGDIVLMNSEAGFFDAFKGIKTRIKIDAKDGKYRFQSSNVEGVDGNGIISSFGKLEGSNRYRIEPMTNAVLTKFSSELKSYLETAKAESDW